MLRFYVYSVFILQRMNALIWCIRIVPTGFDTTFVLDVEYVQLRQLVYGDWARNFLQNSYYSRHIAGGGHPKILNSLLEIWQREKFGQLILVRIIEIVATRCQILRVKCTKFDFGWVPRPLAAFKGPTSEGRQGGEGNGGERRGGKRMGGSPGLFWFPPRM